MLQPILKDLNSLKIVLASTSPRRKQLLENIGLKFDIVPSKFEENLKKESFATPLDYVRETARQKTLEVVHRLYSNEGPPPDLIIGADTIVTMDDKIYEKPSSRDNAVKILLGFSGRSHTVFTSVVLVTPNTSDMVPYDHSAMMLALEQFCRCVMELGSGDKYKLLQYHESTDVQMGDLTKDIVEAYVDTGEPMDKAGGYGIQALGSTLIKSVSGDYFNVIGFPLHTFAKNLLSLFPPS